MEWVLEVPYYMYTRLLSLITMNESQRNQSLIQVGNQKDNQRAPTLPFSQLQLYTNMKCQHKQAHKHTHTHTLTIENKKEM